jgi:hypothetical protein
MKKAALVAAMAGISAAVLLCSPALAVGTFSAFGPMDFNRGRGKPVAATAVFSVLDPTASYTLHVYNAGKDKKGKQFERTVAKAVITLNGTRIVWPDDLNKRVYHIQKPVDVLAHNTLVVELRSSPGSGLTIEIIGLDSTPPAIAALATPPPNAAGWNRTDVTVTFVCSDTTSGVASCPEPVQVSQEGANQLITGTATDVAGNTASASVSVSLDRTAPAVTIVSPPSGGTADDTPVAVQGTVVDALSGVIEVACNGMPANTTGTSFTCNVPLGVGENSLAVTAEDRAGNTGSATSVVAYLGATYLAIVDVRVTDDVSEGPADYTGVAWGETCTEPYLPGVTGTRRAANDLNLGIGSPTTLWVKYGLVPVGSDQPVLVDYRVFEWPDWVPWCPLGWQKANGTSAGIQGALNPGMNDCEPKKGLCVSYKPMNSTDSFITNVGLSLTYGNVSVPCPPIGRANSGFWPMQTGSLTIKTMTGECVSVGSVGLYLCQGRGNAWPAAPTSIEATESEKLDLLHRYAPKVWMAEDEDYWPSSVEWAFPHLVRTPCVEGPGVIACGTGAPPGSATSYWLFRKETGPVSGFDFYRGCDGSATADPCDLGDAPAYAYWVKKQIPVGENPVDLVEVVDLVYFFYYPYNHGKPVLGEVWESHVGDWEHVTVRLMWGYHEQSGWSLQPVQIYLSAHDFGGIYEWDAIPKDGTHPVVYSAWGSHGVWLTPGNHQYGSALGWPLVDVCSAGTAWDTWNNLEAFDYNGKQGLGGSIWPLWMSDDFANPGSCGNHLDPACGAIYRWGDIREGCVPGLGYCLLTDGPTGPVSKDVWSPGILK